MTRGLYDAEVLERWGVINRVVPDGTVHEKGMKFAHQLAAGPTIAHAATKKIVKAVSDGGVAAADEVTPGVFAGLFATEDLQNAVRSFLAEGPGKATFEGK
jgi:enoyl-CoA hydratase/carnithine racemase